MSKNNLKKPNNSADVIRLEKMYNNLVEKLELYHKKGKILKKELERAINDRQIKSVLRKIKS